MRVLLITLLCSYSWAFYGADGQQVTLFNDPADLMFGMYGTEGHKLPVYTYDQKQLTPLTYETVVACNPFFMSKENADQEEKDKILEIAQAWSSGDYRYLEWRANIAATALIKANVRKAQKERPTSRNLLLNHAAIMQDFHLTKLLFECDADVNEIHSTLNKIPIFYAKTVVFAQLLIDYKVLKDMSSYRQQQLLDTVVESDYEPALISLYKNNGITLNDWYEMHDTPLMHLARCPQEYMVEKATLLLDGLSLRKIRSLLAVTVEGPYVTYYTKYGARYNERKKINVFTIIEKSIKDRNYYFGQSSFNKEKIAQLVEYENFLRAKEKEIELISKPIIRS